MYYICLYKNEGSLNWQVGGFETREARTAATEKISGFTSLLYHEYPSKEAWLAHKSKLLNDLELPVNQLQDVAG